MSEILEMPNTFTAGCYIVATSFNDNFDAIVNCVTNGEYDICCSALSVVSISASDKITAQDIVADSAVVSFTSIITAKINNCDIDGTFNVSTDLDMNTLNSIINVKDLKFSGGDHIVIKLQEEDDIGIYYRESDHRWYWEYGGVLLSYVDLDNDIFYINDILQVGGSIKLVDNGYLGIVSDTDLVRLTDEAVVVNGSLVVTSSISAVGLNITGLLNADAGADIEGNVDIAGTLDVNTGIDMNDTGIDNANYIDFGSDSASIIRHGGSGNSVFYDSSNNRWVWQGSSVEKASIDLDNGNLSLEGDLNVKGYNAYVRGDFQVSEQFILVCSGLTAPSAANDSGVDGAVPGDIRWDTSYLYICVAANTWTRIALSW